MTNTALAQSEHRNPVEIVREQLNGEKMLAELRVALPSNISVVSFKQVAIAAVNKNPDLAHADRGSLFTSCVECAQDGLLPNGKEAALVIYKTKAQGNGYVSKVRYMPMIAGLYKKARSSGDIQTLRSHVVYEADHFVYSLGLEPNLEHEPALMADRGKAVGAYAVARLQDGTVELEFMPTAEINEVRKASKSPDKGPWAKWWSEMARKTVVRRLYKRLPTSTELDRIIDRENMHYDQDKLEAPSPPQTPIATTEAILAQAEADLGEDVIDAEVEEPRFTLPADFDAEAWYKRMHARVEMGKESPDGLISLFEAERPTIEAMCACDLSGWVMDLHDPFFAATGRGIPGTPLEDECAPHDDRNPPPVTDDELPLG